MKRIFRLPLGWLTKKFYFIIAIYVIFIALAIANAFLNGDNIQGWFVLLVYLFIAALFTLNLTYKNSTIPNAMLLQFQSNYNIDALVRRFDELKKTNIHPGTRDGLSIFLYGVLMEFDIEKANEMIKDIKEPKYLNYLYSYALSYSLYLMEIKEFDKVGELLERIRPRFVKRLNILSQFDRLADQIEMQVGLFKDNDTENFDEEAFPYDTTDELTNLANRYTMAYYYKIIGDEKYKELIEFIMNSEIDAKSLKEKAKKLQ